MLNPRVLQWFAHYARVYTITIIIIIIVAADSRSYSSDLAKIRGAAPILKEIIKLCTELTFEQLKFIKHLRKCYIC